MSVMDELAPVTLIVKAPNQKIEDRRVACDKSWTVRQLKEHLSTVYPEKPGEDQQKLVYYGKLLKDDSHLHEVLTHDTYEDAHTVHLVCPQHSSAKPFSNHTATKPQFMPADAITEPLIPQNTEQFGEGLRSRFQSNFTAFGLPSQQNPQSMPVSYADLNQLTAQQKLWIQAYQQQYQWWLYQAQLQQMTMYNQLPQAQSIHPATVQQHAAVPGAAEQVRQAAAAANDDAIEMNAQGGVEADVGQRDWLDRMYSLFRFIMIASLFYFYTTVSRFLTVCAIALFFYLAQGNLNMRLQRRQINRGGPGAAPPEENQAENQNNENAERSNPDTDNPETSTQQPPVVQRQEHRSGLVVFIRTIFTFVFSFFASLIPQQPELLGN